MNNRRIGSDGERAAEGYLVKKGYSILCRNYTCPGGEVDIVATNENKLCFVEVKLRSISGGEVASQAVDSVKLNRIKTSMEHFLQEYRDNLYISSLSPVIEIIEIYTANGVIRKYNHITDIG